MRYVSRVLLCFLMLFPLTVSASFFDDDAPAPCISGNGASFDVQVAAEGKLSSDAVNAILGARKSIRIVARDFISKPISEALVKKRRTGVEIQILLNKKSNQGSDSTAQFLVSMSMSPFETYRDDSLFENYIVIDDKDIILGNIGTFIDDEDAKKADADILVIHNAPDLAKYYLTHWQKLWAVSTPIKRTVD